MDTDADNSNPRRRWFRLTPDRCLLALFGLDCVLPLSDRFGWFAFNEHKNWALLINLGIVGVAGALLSLWWAASLLLRWRFRFTIRSLLAMVIVIAIPLSWLAAARQQAERQRAAIDAIAKLTADRVTIGVAEHTEPGWSVKLVKLLGLEFFEDVLVVDMAGTNTTDAQLERLKCLGHIHLLNLRETAITDAGLINLKGLHQLGSLRLGKTKISDAGLVNLLGLSNLHELDLSQTAITDAGLAKLKGLQNLTKLHVEFTAVTDAGVRELQRGLPNCKIYR